MRSPSSGPQASLFGSPPEQKSLNLDQSSELGNRARRAVDELDSVTRSLLNAAREASCARTAATGGPRECALVEALRILEAARVACLNARSLLALHALRPVADEDETTPEPEAEA